MVEKNRYHDLVKAYKHEYGSVKIYDRAFLSGPGHKRKVDLVEALDIIEPSETAIEGFKTHGIAHVSIPLSNMGVSAPHLISLSDLSGAKYAWVKNIKRDKVSIIISSGAQHTPALCEHGKPKKCISLVKNGYHLEGVQAFIYYRNNPNNLTACRLSLSPLHSRLPRKPQETNSS
ncbi:MAG: hypothetical protein Q8P80_02540 [Candidatus Levybacteria bacterium]|nr:hypothetical protein [Candidatus Levybacteria bacterium]